MIPIAKPWVGETEADAARDVVLSGWLTQGAQVEAFEQEFAQMTGAPFACAVSSCTTALDLALRAIGVAAGDEIITPSHSFIAAANSIRRIGAVPVFVDVDPHTFNIDPQLIAAAITPRTRAILPVHQMGMPCDMAAILRIARAQGLAVIEDAACATGTQHRIDGDWEMVGAPRGDIACFSFHPRKVMTTGEGGMLTTSNPEFDRNFRLWRQHGMDVSDRVRHSANSVVFESYVTEGTNGRMTDIQAAIGRHQLARLSDIISLRRRLAARYGVLLAGTGLAMPHEPEWAQSNWQSFCVRLPEGADQRDVMQGLLDRGVASRRGIMCAHREPPYTSALHAPLRNSEAAQVRCILLPLFAQMTDDEQDEVATAVHAVLRP